MEAHPVPQNVTDFQFHLVGDMTLKQFGYLAFGVVVAYVIFATLSGPFPYIAWPLIVIFAGSGAAFAFLPVKERPLDHWVRAYFSAIFRPTIRSWKSDRKDIAKGDPIFNKRLAIFLQGLGEEEEAKLNQPRLSTISQYAPTTQMLVSTPTVPTTAPTPIPSTQTNTQSITSATPPTNLPVPNNPQPTPSPQSVEPTPVVADTAQVINAQSGENPHNTIELAQMVELAKQAHLIQQKILETEKQLEQIKASAAVPGANTTELAKNFQQVLKVFQELTSKGSEISQKLADYNKVEQPVEKVEVKVVKSNEVNVVETQINLTSTPNIINGIVTDAQNNYIEGVIVVTHNKEGLPVRALKTNKLGQFVAATPLPNGTYTLTLEKDSLVFDKYQVELDGALMQPLRIAAKKMGG